MSLPTDPNMAWPPPGATPTDIHTWRAWYGGNPAQLQANAAPSRDNKVARSLFFWRRQRDSATVRQPPPVHVPLAAEIAQSSADLLFGEMPELQTGEAAQQRLDEIAVESGLANVLLEAAEICAAISGVFLRVSWDAEVADYPFVTVVAADHAVPEFAYGRYLRGVTFWRELPAKDRSVWRHLERHEPGVILHGLFVGDKIHLGRSIALTDHEQTAGLDPVVELPEGAGTMLTWYVPNVRPNRGEPHSPHGRADIQGAEELLDGLDETYSSWVRDIRLGKARILVPHEALDSVGERGGGKWFDTDAEVFTELDGLDSKDMNITVTEFAIRAADHAATAINLLERIVSGSGYSPQTFGLHIEGRAESGTALRLREGKTGSTVDRKRRYWAPALKAACEALLAVDHAIFGRPTTVEQPVLIWPKARQAPQELAQTLTMLRAAEAVSIETAVRMAQPDLDDEKLMAEVERIRADGGRIVPEPAF